MSMTEPRGAPQGDNVISFSGGASVLHGDSVINTGTMTEASLS
jgi:hypothetical protein